MQVISVLAQSHHLTPTVRSMYGLSFRSLDFHLEDGNCSVCQNIECLEQVM
jgi:hypothetical protein